jgi:hypothetical protein
MAALAALTWAALVGTASPWACGCCRPDFGKVVREDMQKRSADRRRRFWRESAAGELRATRYRRILSRTFRRINRGLTDALAHDLRKIFRVTLLDSWEMRNAALARRKCGWKIIGA